MAQAGRRWQRTLFPWLKEWGLHACDSDSCVFFLHKEVNTPSGPRADCLVVGCYVDDLFVLYNNGDEHSLYHAFTTSLQERWQVDDEGEVSDLLNIEIKREAGHILLRQTAYIEKMCKEWFPEGVPAHVQANSTPHSDNLPALVLDAVSCQDTINPELLRRYQSIVGSLLYAAINTRPDIAYAVGMLCRAMSKPTEDLFSSALRVLAYLFRHRFVGLRFEPSSEPLSGMTDSDWAGDEMTRRSTSGGVVCRGSHTISWWCKLQSNIALSSCEAELNAALKGAVEGLNVQGLALSLIHI